MIDYSRRINANCEARNGQKYEPFEGPTNIEKRNIIH